MGAFVYRVMGAALFDAGVYEGVENDRRATSQAALVVLLSSAAAGVGAGGVYGPRLSALLAVSALALVTWIAWATLVVQIGSRVLPEATTRADAGQLLRTIGFAAAPGLVQVLAIFPRMAVPAFALAWVWMIAAMVVAVKHALDYRSTGRAIVVCLLSAGLALGLAIVLGIVFGQPVS